MFHKVKTTKFLQNKTAIEGEQNADLQTTESCNISIWTTGGKILRYKRLVNQIIPVPCLPTDRQFRFSHDAMRLYYLGVKDGANQLVVVHLLDLSYEYFALGEKAADITTFEHSSLVKNYLCF